MDWTFGYAFGAEVGLAEVKSGAKFGLGMVLVFVLAGALLIALPVFACGGGNLIIGVVNAVGAVSRPEPAVAPGTP